MFDDHNKKRADDAEAMWLGTAVAARKSQNEHRGTLKTLDVIRERLSSEAADLVSMTADRDAFKALADALLYENSHPEEERRFSDPQSVANRTQLLEDVHRHSWATIINREKKAEISLSPATIEKARTKSKGVLNEYKKISNELGRTKYYKGNPSNSIKKVEGPKIVITPELLHALGIKKNI